jgi:hypothetical protein
VSNDKCFKQSNALPSGSTAEAAVPISKRCLQLAAPEAQSAQLQFDGSELASG